MNLFGPHRPVLFVQVIAVVEDVENADASFDAASAGQGVAAECATLPTVFAISFC